MSTPTDQHQTRTRTVVIGADAGQRIDNYLLRELKGVPRSRVYRMLRKGEVRINGGRVKPEYRLRVGDSVRIPPWHGSSSTVGRAPRGLVARLEARVLHEDADLLVLDKPVGIAVHGGSGVAIGVVEALRQRSGEQRLELAHRIDRDTSGVLLLARNRTALVALHAAFRDGRVRKCYDALVHGDWKVHRQTVSAPLQRVLAGGGERRVKVDAGAGKSARTDFELRESSGTFSWIRAIPHTGRTHQIRVHCATAGHPIVGDEKYAGDDRVAAVRALGVRRLCLHASALTVTIAGVERRFETPPPEDFEHAWRSLSGKHA